MRRSRLAVEISHHRRRDPPRGKPRERQKCRATGADVGTTGLDGRAGQLAQTSGPRERRKGRATGTDVGNLTLVTLSRTEHLSNRLANAARQASRSARRLSNRLARAAGRRRGPSISYMEGPRRRYAPVCAAALSSLRGGASRGCPPANMTGCRQTPFRSVNQSKYWPVRPAAARCRLPGVFSA